LRLAFLNVPVAPLFAFGNLSDEEVRMLFPRKTAESSRREGTGEHVEPSDVDLHAQPFLMYFPVDGAARYLRGSGEKWRLDGQGNLCVQRKGKKGGCAPSPKRRAFTVSRQNGRTQTGVARDLRYIHPG
jgi:hypothetical protein